MASGVHRHPAMGLWNDFRYGVRTLRKAPGFSATTIVTLALGIGATTALFSVCDGMLWKPVPLPNLDRLAVIGQEVPDGPDDWQTNTMADLDDVQRQSQSFERIGWWTSGLANIVGSTGEPERVDQSLVSPDFFPTIGVQPALGRTFLPGEDQAGRDRVVVLGYPLWRRLFAGDPNVIGKTIRFDDEDYEIVGVMPKNFEFPKPAAVWTPYAPRPEIRTSRTARAVIAVGLLRPGVQVERARAELAGIASRLESEHPDTNKNRRFKVESAHEFLIGYYNRQYTQMLFGAALFVLLIACANVANLHFARASGRVREVAIRTALGAGRWRLMAQMLTESILLALAGAAAGLAVASWGIELIRAGMPPEIEKFLVGWNEIRLDGRALAFTFFSAVLTGLLAGLIPGIQHSRPNVNEALKESGRSGSSGRGRHRIRTILVGAQITLAVVLLVGASLMTRGFQTVVQTGSVIEPDTLLTFRLAITANKYQTGPQRSAFYKEVMDRIATLPGVRSAAAASALPYSNHSSGREFDLDGKQSEPSNRPSGMYQSVSADYFTVLRAGLRAGRFLQTSDGPDAPRVVVINERMAQRWWPGEDLPIGKRMRVRTADGSAPWMTIVGVVSNLPHDVNDRAPRAAVYVPYLQVPQTWMDIAIRTAGNPAQLASAARAAVHAVDREQPVTDIAGMKTLVYRQATGLTYVSVLMGVFGLLALALSSVGVYGVMAYVVTEQTHEIGIRMALGAARATVLKMIFRRGMRTVGVGLAIGIPLAYAMAKLLSSLVLVWGVSERDPATFVGIPLALLLSAAVAIYVPARRATRIDPLVALRHE